MAWTGESLSRLAFRKGFVGTLATCAALVVALPAGAAQKGGTPGAKTGPVAGAAPPVAAQGAPPGADQARLTDPAPAKQPEPQPQAPPPPAEDQRAPAEPPAGEKETGGQDEAPAREPSRADADAEQPSPIAGSAPAPRARRFEIRTVENTAPEPASPPGEERADRDGARANGGGEERAQRPARRRPPAAVRGVVRSAAPAPPATGSSPIAAVADGEGNASTASRPRAEVVEPEQPLPVRIVPRQLRQIVEVVPAGLWAALAALGLLALALALSSWLTTRRARRLKRQREALLEEVGVLQAALLPKVADDVPASVAYLPAAGERAGGDFYDAFALADGSTGVILGEVAPAGRESLARTTFVRYTLRAYLEAGMSPREVVKVGSQALSEHLEAGFAAVTVATYERESGRLTFATAGHAPPLVVGGEPFEPVIACSSPPLGLDEPTGLRQTTITLTAGAVACLYSRGLTESRRGERPLGVETLAAELRALPPDADAGALLERIEARGGDLTADMAVCLLRAPAEAPVAGPRVEELEVDEREVGDSLELFLRACGVPLPEVPGVLREAGEAARREGTATVRVRLTDFRPGVDVVPGNLVRLEDRRAAALF